MGVRNTKMAPGCTIINGGLDLGGDSQSLFVRPRGVLELSVVERC
jgi:hypothetical protein